MSTRLQDRMLPISIKVGGGQGSILTPNWVVTSSHCVGYQPTEPAIAKRPVKYFYGGEQWETTHIFRHPKQDIALVKLAHPHRPKDISFPQAASGEVLRKNHRTIPMRKAIVARIWDNIPMRAGRGGSGYVSKRNRRGKAGTSGSPWLFHSEALGKDVYFGPTQGSGRAPDVAAVKSWLLDIIQKHTTDPEADKIEWVSYYEIFPELFTNVNGRSQRKLE